MLTVEEFKGSNTTQAQMTVTSMLKIIQIIQETEKQSSK